MSAVASTQSFKTCTESPKPTEQTKEITAGRPSFDQFDAESEDNESYLERLQEYFTAYDIKDDKDCAAKRRATLLTSIRSNCFRVLKDLAFPDVPNMKTFDHDLISWLLCYASILS